MAQLKEVIKRNETFYKNRDGLHPDIVGFSEELLQVFPDAVFTSGKREGAKTKAGKTSRHHHGEAVDLRITPAIADFLENDSRGIQMLHKYQLGFLDESTKEGRKWGNALHIGKDSALVAKTNKKFSELRDRGFVNENPIVDNKTALNSFVIKDDPVFNTPKTDQLVQEDSSSPNEQEDESQEARIERELTDSYEDTPRTVIQQPQEEVKPFNDVNVFEDYENISTFVNSKHLREGGNIPSSERGLWDYPNQVVNVPTDGNITMSNINHPVLGISRETGERKIMLPNYQYFFSNTNNVVEVPLKS